MKRNETYSKSTQANVYLMQLSIQFS